jgi:hypothetical protein
MHHASPYIHETQQEDLHTSSEGGPIPPEGDLPRAQLYHKFSKEALDKLQAWVEEHPDNSYPLKDESRINDTDRIH